MTPADVAASLRDLAEHMLDVASQLTYYGGFDEEAVQHGRELVGAASLARSWADHVEGKTT